MIARIMLNYQSKCFKYVLKSKPLSRQCIYFDVKMKFSTEQNGQQKYRLGASTENIWNIPNFLTMSRIVSSPLIAVSILLDWKSVALCGCLTSVFTDCLDGYIAKKFNQQTVFGSYLDPLADKIFIASVSISLAMKSLLPHPLLLVVIGRDVILVFGSAYLRWREMPPGASYFDISNSATFSISPSLLGKGNSAIQFILLSVTLSHFCLEIPVSIDVVEPLWWIVSVTTVGSGLDYLLGREGMIKIAR